MRIVVNDIAASTGGALTVLKEFYDCIKEYDRENEWIFLLGDNLLEETENIKIHVLREIKSSGIKKIIFDFFSGKKYIEKLKPDVVVSLQNIITFGLKVPQLTYIHQSIPFQATKRFSFLKRSERKLAIYQYLIGAIIKWSAKKCDLVVVQTEWMRQAICHMCHVPIEKVVKVMPDVKGITVRTDVTRFCNYRFFYPTSDEIYKNNEAIVEASRLLTERHRIHEIILTLSDTINVNSITCVGRIAFGQVIENYTTSTLVFPSYIETFGYPLAEARQVGTIILAADTAFAREVLEDYFNAYFFNPFRPEELAALMERVISGEIRPLPVVAVQENQQNSWLKVLEEVYKLGV